MDFIVIDGLDGSGKDTQAKLLVDKYEKLGKNVILRSHPMNDNKYGRKSKSALLKKGKLNKIKATGYYALDVVWYSLRHFYNKKSDDVLIFCRYTLAVMYLPNWIYVYIYKLVNYVLPNSKYMFFLDVSPEESLNRMKNRDEDEEMFENMEELVKARNKSKKVLYNWNVISADNDPESIHKDIWKLCPK